MRRAGARWLAILITLGLFGSIGCAYRSPTPIEERIEFVAVSDGWLAMGTLFDADLRVRPEDAPRARDWLEWSRAEIARLERIYSRHDPDSELSALNRALAGPEALRDGTLVGAELEAILFESIEVWRSSGGAFDPTVGPLVEVWRRAAEEGVWPPLERLQRAKRRVSSRGLLMTGDGEIGLTARGMRIDLDGISKGVVLDRLREHFAEHFPDAAALLSLGESSLVAVGDPGGRPSGGGWRLEARSRDPRASRLATLRLRDLALSVSSSVGRVSEIAGRRLSHVVDPRTGAAVEGTVEAIVVSDRAAIADGWSTALLVLGAGRESTRLVERAGLEACLFESVGRIAVTEGWAALEEEASGS